MEKKYIISDTLQSLIDWDEIMKMERYAGGHDDQMKGLFKEVKVIGHWNEPDYSGMVATCVRFPDGRYGIYNDYYGSCSGCDSWEDATDEEVRNLCINIANGVFIFWSLDDVKEFLSSDCPDEGDWTSWKSCKSSLLKSINEQIIA